MAEILTYPDHTLLQISGLVRDFNDPKIKEIVEELKKTAQEHGLKGLAAIQTGIPLRIIVFEKDGQWQVMINPAIYGKEGKYFKSTETDESLPNIEVTVQRYPAIKIMYQDLEGNDRFYRAEGEESVWLQRKIDMVFGGYLFDKLSKKERKQFFKKYGTYGDTCPRYFIKDRILLGLRYFLTLHFILLITTLFSNLATFVLEHNFALFGFEFAWLIFYALYAKYETTKYKNCTSCQGANVFGTSAIYFGVMTLLLVLSWIFEAL